MFGHIDSADFNTLGHRRAREFFAGRTEAPELFCSRCDFDKRSDPSPQQLRAYFTLAGHGRFSDESLELLCGWGCALDCGYSEGVETTKASLLTPELLAEFEANAKRSLETRLRYSFIHTYKPVLDDARYRSFDTMAEYRRWCNENLPEWLGYKSEKRPENDGEGRHPPAP